MMIASVLTGDVWSLPSTFSMNLKAVTLTTFTFQRVCLLFDPFRHKRLIFIATTSADIMMINFDDQFCKMTSPNGNIFRVTGPLWGESTGHRWIPLAKASDAELCSFLWYVPEQKVEQAIETVIWYAMALIMTSLLWGPKTLCRSIITCWYAPTAWVANSAATALVRQCLNCNMNYLISHCSRPNK